MTWDEGMNDGMNGGELGLMLPEFAILFFLVANNVRLDRLYLVVLMSFERVHFHGALKELARSDQVLILMTRLDLKTMTLVLMI